MLDALAASERQQQPFIGYVLAVGVGDFSDGIGRTLARQAGAIGQDDAGVALRADRIIEIAVGAQLRLDMLVAIGGGQPRASCVMMKRASSPLPSTSKPIMSARSSVLPSVWKSHSKGRVSGMRSARNQAFSSTRCVIDLITDGSALANGIG